jgi:hypothetical protein
LGHVRQNRLARKSEPTSRITKIRSVSASLWIAPALACGFGSRCVRHHVSGLLSPARRSSAAAGGPETPEQLRARVRAALLHRRASRAKNGLKTSFENEDVRPNIQTIKKSRVEEAATGVAVSHESATTAVNVKLLLPPRQSRGCRAVFQAGAALAALDARVRADAPFAGVWRRRLPATCSWSPASIAWRDRR